MISPEIRIWIPACFTFGWDNRSLRGHLHLSYKSIGFFNVVTKNCMFHFLGHGVHKSLNSKCTVLLFVHTMQVGTWEDGVNFTAPLSHANSDVVFANKTLRVTTIGVRRRTSLLDILRVNQSINQPIDRSIHRSINQSINRLINHFICQENSTIYI